MRERKMYMGRETGTREGYVGETETEIEGNKKTKGWKRGWNWRKKYRQKTGEKKWRAEGGW